METNEDEIYVATDIETDGPSPGDYSMLSFGSVAFRRDRSILGTFERNLATLPGARQNAETMRWWATQAEAWAAHRRKIVEPVQAMKDYLAWLRQLPTGKPVFVAHPVGFDFTFVSWYLFHFTGENPFHPAALDLTSFAMAILGTPYNRSSKASWPAEWFDPTLEHTHVALDDAHGYAVACCGMFEAAERLRARR